MTWILVTLIFISVSILAVIIYRKLPQIRVIDVSTIPKERERQVKEQLILANLHRTVGAKFVRLAKIATQILNTVSRHGRRAVQRLYRLEQYYQRLKHTQTEGVHAYDETTIHRRIEEADRLLEQDEYIPAEKIFIDIISHNPKSVDAYEGLGNLYMENEQLDQARETLQFALRLSPDDASINVSLAELEMKQGHQKQALVYLRHAIEKRPKNPRYLDFFIEAALETGSLKDARKGILALKECNPDNQKISEFESRFQEKKEAYIRRTSGKEEHTSQEN